MNTDRLKRRLRQRMFDYPEHKQDQAGRIIRRCKQREEPARRAEIAARRKTAGEAYARVMWM